MEVLDVEVEDPPPPTAYDSINARSAMKESETGLAFVRQQEICDDDWEEKVNKSGEALMIFSFILIFGLLCLRLYYTHCSVSFLLPCICFFCLCCSL